MMELERNDLDHIHDVIYNALGINLQNDEQILKYWNKVPKHLQLEGEEYGCADSVFRDNLYEWFRDNEEAIKVMDAKGKALELFQMFYYVACTNKAYYKAIGKQCAIKHVEEILEILNFDLGHDPTARAMMEFYEEVKKEIENYDTI